MSQYLTHDNGGRVFKVIIENDNIVKVYLNYEIPEYRVREVKEFENIKVGDLLHTFQVEKVFIGKSLRNKMTDFSSGYGPEFDGNSILLHLNENNYVFIGNSIFSFQSLYKIKNYCSPVGNNDVPYPYAIDENENIYLMKENIVLTNTDKAIHKDPYNYYYDGRIITTDDLYCSRVPLIRNFDNIENTYTEKIDSIQSESFKKIFSLMYSPFPEKYYERLINPYPNTPNMVAYLTRHNLLDRLNKQEKVYITYLDEETEELTKEKYLELNQKFGNEMGFQTYSKNILTNRLV